MRIFGALRIVIAGAFFTVAFGWYGYAQIRDREFGTSVREGIVCLGVAGLFGLTTIIVTYSIGRPPRGPKRRAPE